MFKLFKRKKKQAPEPILISKLADIVTFNGDYYLVETRCHKDIFVTEVFSCDEYGTAARSISLHDECCSNEETAQTRHKYIMNNLGRILFVNWDGDAEFKNGCMDLLERIKKLQSEHYGVTIIN